VELTEKIAKFLSDDRITARMVFYTGTKKNNIKSYYIELRKDAKEAIRNIYSEYVNKVNKQNLPLTVFRPIDYDPNKLAVLNLDKIQKSEQIVKSNPERLEKLSPPFIKKIKFNSIFFQNSDLQSLIVFRRYPQKTRFLSKLSWRDSLALIFDDNILKLSDPKDTILVDPRIDCIVFDEQVIIFRRNTFEDIFSYHNVYHSNSNKLFRFFETNRVFKIDELDKIKKECNTRVRLRKISSIYLSDYYSRVELSSILNINSDYKLGITIDKSTNTAVFPDTDTFLKLFSDDYLKSELTNSHYISHNKEKV
jgi:hypothetical protein